MKLDSVHVSDASIVIVVFIRVQDVFDVGHKEKGKKKTKKIIFIL